jgi:Putative transposase
MGYLSQDGDIVQNPALDPLFQEDSALYQATVQSIAGKVAFGPRAGNYERRLGRGFGYDEEVPLAKGKQCLSVNGFSLHANTAINTHSRDRLGSLVKYLARGPLSNERLTSRENGDVELPLKSRWKNCTTHLLF